MNVEDCYQELGVPPDSSDAQVKAAWRRLALRWHPDRNDSPQALARIQRINRALEEIRRAREEGAPSAAPGDEPPAAPVAEQEVAITLEEVVSGCDRDLRGEVQEDCADCEGRGLQVPPPACAACGGSGQVRQPLWFGWVAAQVECEACEGRGTACQACATCGGGGKAPPRKYRCRARIPPGARAGDCFDVKARVQGQRQKHELALRMRLRILPHDLFQVEGDGTVRCELPVDGFLWVANRWIEVPTPHGPRQMRLQRGSLGYRIKGGGLPWQADGAAADCIVTVVPCFADDWTPEQAEAIDRLVACHAGAAGTPAGERMAEWGRRAEAWAQGLAGKPGAQG